jgi:CheY-like chemotaxis protein
VNLLAEVDKAAMLIRTTFPTGIALHLDLHPDVPAVAGDPAQVQQVLMNLCANARYAMRDTGGELVIAALPRSIDATEAEALGGIEPGDYAELSVSDSGPGMDTNIAGRIFEPFFTTKPVGEGTGLGLAIVHSIVEAHGGVVSIVSAPGQGTRVQLLLPTAGLEALPEGSVPLPVQDQEIACPPRRVAVIDDESQIRLFLRIMLEDAGHTPLCYRSGEEALAAITAMESPPDVALVDLVMPGMGGIALSNELKRACPGMPIIICTGHINAERNPEVQALGAASIVKKPVPPGQLLNAIADATAHITEAVAT